MSSWAPPYHSLKSTLDQPKPQAGLYIVSTPIGNKGDMTLRALHALGTSDLVLCEDTRISQKLLLAYDIKTPLMAYHDHNGERMRPKIKEKLEQGQTIVLISDAGTPLVSDPGYKLVQMCHECNIYVTALPGPSAPLMALTLSGLPSDQFFFVGFLPPKSGARENALKSLETIKASLIVFESGPRLEKSLSACLSVLGDRPMALTRELTKKFEEIRRGPISEILSQVQEKGPPKGEIVLVIQGASQDTDLNDTHLVQLIQRELEQGHSMKDAIQRVSEANHIPRRRVYKLGLGLTDNV